MNHFKRSSILSVAEAIGLMISFGSLIATIIFGLLSVIKNDKKINLITLAELGLFFSKL
ncbi:putative holin-like toxin [Vagococcus xieshaowenii]|uniref:putative holin-like toxin n=1 Tax=Vagococcus xieshaowenii TaxID=2562451 RepID=UPI00143277B0|nr:putative holin-like toxin [Vagococcus xieshaowenii]